MSFRFFATPTVVFRSSRLGEDFSKFPESSYRSSKKKLKIVLTMTHTPTTTWWRKRVIWFTFYPIAFIQTTNTGFVPFLSSSCPPTHFYFLPTHNALIGCFIKWPKKTPVNWSVVLCGQNEVKSAKKKKIDWFLAVVFRCPQGSFSEYYIFFPPTRDLLLCMSPQKSIFPDSSLFMLFLGLSLKLGMSHPY